MHATGNASPLTYGIQRNDSQNEPATLDDPTESRPGRRGGFTVFREPALPLVSIHKGIVIRRIALGGLPHRACPHGGRDESREQQAI